MKRISNLCDSLPHTLSRLIPRGVVFEDERMPADTGDVCVICSSSEKQGEGEDLRAPVDDVPDRSPLVSSGAPSTHRLVPRHILSA